jgi:hypothetical protein
VFLSFIYSTILVAFFIFDIDLLSELSSFVQVEKLQDLIPEKLDIKEVPDTSYKEVPDTDYTYWKAFLITIIVICLHCD